MRTYPWRIMGIPIMLRLGCYRKPSKVSHKIALDMIDHTLLITGGQKLKKPLGITRNPNSCDCRTWHGPNLYWIVIWLPALHASAMQGPALACLLIGWSQFVRHGLAATTWSAGKSKQAIDQVSVRNSIGHYVLSAPRLA